METRFLRSESPPEGRAKYWNNIPPTTWSLMPITKLTQGNAPSLVEVSYDCDCDP